MKKIPIFILSILISSHLFIPAHLASASIQENSTTWWSVEELLDFYQEVEAEKNAECGGNQECQMEFGFNMIERGEKYRALNNLIETQFWVTSINPTTETIKVLFFDEDMMLKRMGIKEKLEIEQLFIGWFEDWTGQIYYYGFDSLIDGFDPKLHQLYSSKTEKSNTIIPWQENELPMFDPNILDNTSGKLGYSIFARDNKFNAQGAFDYSNCTNAPDYEPGVECKMYISADQWVAYFPPREELKLNEIVTEFMQESAEESSDNREETPTVDTTEIELKSEPKPESNTEKAPEAEPATPKLVIPEVPNTGKGSCERIIEFPWWFMVLLAIGDALLLWLFWPSRIHKSQKISKNPKKIS